jgi:hypothetical protein
VIGAVPLQDPGDAERVSPCCVDPLIVGAVRSTGCVAGGGVPDTGPTARLVAFADPEEFVAVTVTLTIFPTSAALSRSLAPVPPLLHAYV